VTISLREAFQGTTRRIEVDGRRLEVKIPRGARSGTKIRVADAITSPQGDKSDLYLLINVADEPNFERKGNDLYTHVEVDLYKAVLGGEVTVPTLSGNVVLTIPPGTQPGQTIRLAGQGMPHIKNPESRGDLFVNVKVKIPRNLTADQRELFQKLARSN
jgi:curved DNA-binding protein